jgi:CarD family transcriptional regulator
MGFQIGDKVIHWTYGLGEIVHIEEKVINGRTTNCYVFRTPDLAAWIPVNELQQGSLRMPTSPEEFEKVFTTMTAPCEGLLEDRILRKNQLMAQMTDGKLLSICQVVRDLTNFKRGKKLNEQEKYILERAIKSLLTEWAYSLNVSLIQAQLAMTNLLEAPQQA